MEESDDELVMSASLPDEPLTFAEALIRPDAEKWRQAALEELAAHQTNGTWTLVLILGACAPLIVLLDAFLVITLAVSLYG